ncbi:glycoside hydrolase family 3 N-terminal domain-containing protein [Jiangella rhizosphaerae]|uniref:Exo-alpha-(1->6)-L-arabinopyranosidase n=1 Tax=Jiangella rhizosphaerae TaxID=2293569 RepID=A0A418KI90_9ACTN|nr:glycoside hydrolase family 3 N-terminal domain-containing protein [Jiangella rhizosphaerae]RIQ12682.1 glycosyl hydrolase [Jiangella rhizosphaerae]
MTADTWAGPLSGPWHDTTLPLAERVDALLAAMTPEEKAGQLGSFWHRPAEEPDGDVAPMESEMAGPGSFADAIAYGLGHLTRVFGTAPVSVADGIADLRARQAQVMRVSRFGIPAIAHEECLTGFTAYGATVYPTPLAWGAAFDPGLVEEMAAAIGRDLRAVGVDQGLSPVLDVVRDYRWGRVEESIGEDPYLVATVATAYVRGLQSTGVVATLKHFAGYSASRSARNHAPVAMGPRELAEVLLPPFELAIREGGAGSVMPSYAAVDGVPPTASRALLTSLLREEWGFGGTVVSDYWAVPFLHKTHRIAGGDDDAGVLALTAGVDVELPETVGFAGLAALVRAGAVPEAVLDDAARRVLLQKARLGLLDPGWAPRTDDGADLDSPANRALARRLAERSVVLLANDGTLPLAPAAARVAVVGTTAVEPRTFLGCYSFPNHVLAQHGGDDLGVAVPTLLDALRAELPDSVVSHAPGAAITGEDRSGFAAAVALAAQADVAIVTVGDLAGLFGRGTSGEGCDAPDLTLPGVQADLVAAVLDTGTPVVLVVVSGRPYALGDLAPRCAAVVQAFFPGEEGGAAIAGVLSGRIDPSGRLPVAVPRTPSSSLPTYRAAPLDQRTDGVSNLDPAPLYPFGHGLSYTTVTYESLVLSAPAIPSDGSVDVTVTVRNTGARPAEEVVQLYLTDHAAQVVRPVRELIGYRRVPLAPGEARRVTFAVHADRTSFPGLDLRRIVEPGTFTLAAGPSSDDVPVSAELEISGAVRVLDGARVMTTPVRID